MSTPATELRAVAIRRIRESLDCFLAALPARLEGESRDAVVEKFAELLVEADFGKGHPGVTPVQVVSLMLAEALVRLKELETL